MDDPNEPLLPPQPDPNKRRLDVGNLKLGCLHGFGVSGVAITGCLLFVLGEPVWGFVGTIATLGLVVLMFRNHFVMKQRSYLLGALLFIGFAALCFGYCAIVV
jgi:hypothetical protein